MKILVMPRAEKELRAFQKKEQKIFLALLEGIDEIHEKGLLASNIKSLSGVQNGYRKQVGRSRILFTAEMENNVLKIWIVAIEKDTKKDYEQWMAYLRSKM